MAPGENEFDTPGIEEATGESSGAAALAHWEVREKGPWRKVLGVSPGQAATAHCSPGCKSCGAP